MDKIFVGYIQGFHGLKGEVKIKNKFSLPEKVFVLDKTIFLNDEKHRITGVRFHKDFYLVEMDNLKDINLVEKYKGYNVFVLKEDLFLEKDEYILEDLINMEIIYEGKNKGVVKNVLKNSSQNLLEIDYNVKYYIPLVDEYIEKVDLDRKQIFVKDIGGLVL